MPKEYNKQDVDTARAQAKRVTRQLESLFMSKILKNEPMLKALREADAKERDARIIRREIATDLLRGIEEGQ